MLIRFSVENYKSFHDKQELVMIPAKKMKSNKEHIIKLDDISLLRNATIYGANASGGDKYYRCDEIVTICNNQKDTKRSQQNVLQSFSGK